MILLLPLAFFLLWMLALREEAPRKAMCTAAVHGGVLLVVYTELLSLLGWLDRTGVGLVWAATCLVLGIRLFRGDEPRARLKELRGLAHPGRSRFRGIVLGWAGLIVGALGLLGVMGVPHEADAMTYHMPRVMHWIQNGTVGHYSTWISRQLYNPPFAEFAAAHVYLLYGGDRLLNLIQGFMLVGSVVAASLWVRRLGGDELQQAVAGVFVLTIPMALMQAMAVKNGLVLSFWLLISGLFLVDAFRADAPSVRRDTARAGAAAGLVVLTKGTGPILLVPLLAVFASLVLRRSRHEWPRLLGLFVLPLLLLNAPHYARNAAVYGHPLGSSEVRHHHLTRTLKPSAAASNVLKNLTIQFTTPFRSVNRRIEAGVRQVHEWMGISPEDPRTTQRFWNYQVFVPVPATGKASSPLHALLFAFALGVIAVRGDPDWPVVLLAGGVLVGFVLLSAALRWHPWIARLHLPLLVAAGPVVGWLFGGGHWRTAARGLLVLLLLEASLMVVLNRVHPVVGQENNVFTAGRTDRYFAARPSAASGYRSIADTLKASDCLRIGLALRETSFEYPLWVLLDPFGTERTLRHVAPEALNTEDFVSAGTPSDEPVCRIVCERPEGCGQLESQGGVRRVRTDSVSLWEVRPALSSP